MLADFFNQCNNGRFRCSYGVSTITCYTHNNITQLQPGVKRMRKQMIISVMSKDRPGIIADITGAIYQLGGDVADLNQTVLCGYLTMILSASFDPEVTKEDLLASISHIKTRCKFEVSIKELDPDQEDEAYGAAGRDLYFDRAGTQQDRNRPRHQPVLF